MFLVYIRYIRSSFSYPQQGAGGVDGRFGQQLAGQVKVRFGLNGRQRHCGNRGQQRLAGRPGSQLLYGPAVVLVEVEGAAGCPRLHSAAHRPVKRQHRKTEGVDQRDGVVEKLSLSRREQRLLLSLTTRF